MRFHSIIYRELGLQSPEAAQAFLRDFKAFKDRRRSFTVNEYDLVISYFFNIFSNGQFPHELRCISGNKHNQRLWMEDFTNVIMPAFIRHYPTITIHSKQNSNNLISELGSLLGIS